MNAIPQSIVSTPRGSGMAHGPQSAFAHAFTMALDSHPRRLSPKYLYDAEGSAWFARICELPEYYLTRTEVGILRTFGREISHCIGPHAELIEFGAGPSTKLRVLLDHLQEPMRYCPVDISGDHLKAESRRLKTDHPWLRVQPIEADFLRPFKWPAVRRGSGPRGRRVGMLLGSSLGNFDQDEARAFLCNAHQMMPGGAMLIGVDLVKDPSVLHAAYNDVAGVTAAFNLNLLARANRELNATFDPGRFFHHACYRPDERCVEMHLISQTRQMVQVCGYDFLFDEGETLHTETSRKFTVSELQHLASSCGWHPGPVWTDVQGWFALQWLESQDSRHLLHA